ncbi:sulfatase family protein [Oceanomicrobium pacificus]|uniref:Sulfatase-like hydrolase/transferase n=1 Tax=Oceanomicrobium pacificus TaxID=2692916 RepID=A0A6B0TVQ7_9RHOB|nr:sulfatase-like hydrolase/transferase [Oceanomicrobium pacificus]MXU65073.1 sulfatase-like hydrolase/transferase [Oceanomicrobium pacificus]
MSRQPDILFLLPDQLRPDFLGCYGAGFLKTPHIDALAEAGLRYETCISPSPICVPARASMLTGQSAMGCGVMDNLHWPRPDRPAMGLRTWPDHLASAGYATAAIGKMHFYPWDISEGFDTRVIAEDKRHIHIRDDYDAALRAAGLRKVHAREQEGYVDGKGASISDLPEPYQVDRWVAGQAAEAIRAADPDRPLAMMVGFPGPHCPYDPPREALDSIDPASLPAPLPRTAESATHHAAFVASYKRGWADIDYSDLTDAHVRGIRHHYAALVERLDQDVGTIIAALRESGRLDNTIVIFASDHGDYLGDFGLVGKTYFHEPAIRVPLIVADFRAPAPGVEARAVSLLDLYPSFLDWAGVEVPCHARGRRLGDIDRDRIITGATVHGMMARGLGWKLVRYRNGTVALFDLTRDPQEQQNRIGDQPEIQAVLDHALTLAVLDGFAAAHADKKVAEAQAGPDHDFYGRGWQRPYPAPIN